jgi:glycosyltransferase involved in cell wall biosynthesis
VQDAAIRQTHAIGAAFVFWLQDLHSVAISRILGRRYPVVGSLIGERFSRLEQRLLRHADAVVVTADDYLETLGRWGLPMENIEVIENWAPLEEMPPQNNAWSAANGLDAGAVVLYAGTLALKHNPALLLDLAKGLSNATIVVAAEGPGADWLRKHATGVANLRIFGLQPYGDVPSMLATADLLVAILEPDASTFSAPSKVLTYLAAGRAVVAAIPAGNAAARLIIRTGAGLVVEPGDNVGLVAAARQLLADPQAMASRGAAGRAYAEQAFDIVPIADRFETTLARAIGSKADTGLAKQRSHEASR